MDVIPALTELSKQGQTGRKKIDRYTRYLGVVLCLFQASTMTYAFDKVIQYVCEDKQFLHSCMYRSF